MNKMTDTINITTGSKFHGNQCRANRTDLDQLDKRHPYLYALLNTPFGKQQGLEHTKKNLERLNKAIQTDAAKLPSLSHHKATQTLRNYTHMDKNRDKSTQTEMVGVTTGESRSIVTTKNVSPNILPPVTPCLTGTCPLFRGTVKCKGDPVWLGCSYQDRNTGKFCSFWVHAKCHGFPRMSKEVLKLAQGFRCPRHLE